MARKSTRASMANVRTHTTRRSSAALPRHELYMKLTALEIERSRRATEREATAKRLGQIDQRIASIETEQGEIKQILERDQNPTSKSRNNTGRMNFAY